MLQKRVLAIWRQGVQNLDICSFASVGLETGVRGYSEELLV